MRECFHFRMVSQLATAGERLSQKMLQGYVGGQALMHHETGDRTIGQIEKIDLLAGAIEVCCDWIAHMGPRKRKWRLDTRREPFLIVFLRSGWRNLGSGQIEVLGENGQMVLTPAGHPEIIEEPMA